MKTIVYTILFTTSSIFLFSCDSSSSTTGSNTTNPHAEAHMEMHKEFKQEQVQKKLAEENETEPTKAQLQQLLIKKNQQGIDFYAIGNEPFWNLNMDFEKGFHFNTLNGLDFKAPAAKFVKAIDDNIIKYRSATASGEIIVQLDQTDCADNMSGQKFDYQVTVDFKTSKESDFKTFKGCGDYVPDFRLHDIWAIIEVEGIKVNPENFKAKLPRIEFNIAENRVFGNDGCNNFNGSFKMEHKRILIGNLASTMMMCSENEEISSKIGKILSNSNLDYTIENNLLILSKDHKKIMVLKHID